MHIGLNKNQLRFFMLCSIWGSTWIGTKAGIEAVPPLLFAGTRFTAAGLLLLLYASTKGQITRLKAQDGFRCAAVSLLMRDCNRTTSPSVGIVDATVRAAEISSRGRQRAGPGNKAGQSRFVSAATAASAMGGFNVKRIRRNGRRGKAVLRDIIAVTGRAVLAPNFRVTRGLERQAG
ncbi:hypothetical protein [Rhizobium hidalgonense]|uniref:hypothetical protein n=1 Tax=Rhizobium hidalgonense TaxID=1538159 RepID=UPI001FEC0081|nr:hypothetical protein [Rhizobium hidalgonense]